MKPRAEAPPALDYATPPKRHAWRREDVRNLAAATIVWLMSFVGLVLSIGDFADGGGRGSRDAIAVAFHLSLFASFGIECGAIVGRSFVCALVVALAFATITAVAIVRAGAAIARGVVDPLAAGPTDSPAGLALFALATAFVAYANARWAGELRRDADGGRAGGTR